MAKRVGASDDVSQLRVANGSLASCVLAMNALLASEIMKTGNSLEDLRLFDDCMATIDDQIEVISTKRDQLIQRRNTLAQTIERKNAAAKGAPPPQDPLPPLPASFIRFFASKYTGSIASDVPRQVEALARDDFGTTIEHVLEFFEGLAAKHVNRVSLESYKDEIMRFIHHAHRDKADGSRLMPRFEQMIADKFIVEPTKPPPAVVKAEPAAVMAPTPTPTPAPTTPAARPTPRRVPVRSGAAQEVTSFTPKIVRQ
ncbi:hypothetical protein J8273_3221 [Carpediemonas membranifera]|uniref:Uncharacterized protein n=1 Tax=Carpediemonas membranifera TaxID=201153 RepID=A0A8J6B559_9EUKA|nr:hypothetical protein J8273_3221 [Carpediemonas membranifera]|eukprot:KAG9393092.1 hypothetical protein J8273_3221 [Carpediemonas membranifera]